MDYWYKFEDGMYSIFQQQEPCEKKCMARTDDEAMAIEICEALDFYNNQDED